LLIGEALYARAYVAPNLQNETAKEAVNQLSTLSAVAAANLIGTRMMQNRTLAKLPPVKGIAAIEAARKVVVPAPAAPRAPAAARAALGALSGHPALPGIRRVALRGGALGLAAAAGAAAVALVQGYYRTDSSGRTSYVQPHQRRIG
jgi:hypothetical protein